jgi:hypothetical protein
MATIRVTCPTCGKALEVDAEHDGQEVECGECLQIFVARGPRGGKITGVPSSRGTTPAARPGSRPGRRRRHDDDDDYEHDRVEEYEEDEYEQRNRRGGESVGASGAAIVGVIFGVVALLTSCCPVLGLPLGIVAMVLGSIGKRSPGSSGAGTAAAVLGSIAFLISAAALVWFLAAGGMARIGK